MIWDIITQYDDIITQDIIIIITILLCYWVSGYLDADHFWLVAGGCERIFGYPGTMPNHPTLLLYSACCFINPINQLTINDSYYKPN